MKKITRVLMLCLALSVFAVSKNYAQQIVVKTRLVAHSRTERPVRPSRRHVWVSAEWAPGGGTYIYHEGYWALPPHRGAIWVSGKWRHVRHGYVWVAGHWSR